MDDASLYYRMVGWRDRAEKAEAETERLRTKVIDLERNVAFWMQEAKDARSASDRSAVGGTVPQETPSTLQKDPGKTVKHMEICLGCAKVERARARGEQLDCAAHPTAAPRCPSIGGPHRDLCRLSLGHNGPHQRGHHQW